MNGLPIEARCESRKQLYLIHELLSFAQYGAVSASEKFFYLTADCTNVTQFLPHFQKQSNALAQHFKDTHNAHVHFILQDPPHVTLLGPIKVDASTTIRK